MKFLTIIFISITNFCISQTSLDSLCLGQINKYRKSNSKNNFTWNNIAYKASNHHSNYSDIQEKISSEVLDTWVESPSHNKILLSNTQLAGISTVIQKQGCGIEGYTNYTVWATLVVYNP